MVTKVVSFFVQDGLADREVAVRSKMLDSALVIVDAHGKEAAEDLLPVFEEFLENAPKSERYDNVRQAVVILMGSLAKHLDTSDPKVTDDTQRKSIDRYLNVIGSNSNLRSDLSIFKSNL